MKSDNRSGAESKSVDIYCLMGGRLGHCKQIQKQEYPWWTAYQKCRELAFSCQFTEVWKDDSISAFLL